MKKLLTIAVLLIGMITTAQEYGQVWGKRDKAWYPFVTIGIDARNIVEGSKPTAYKSEFDLQFKLGARTGNFEGSLIYENFSAIEFMYFGANVNYVFEIIKNTDVALGVEGGMIDRWGGFNFYTGGVNLELRYEIKNTPIILGLQGNARVRPDIWENDMSMPITTSGFVNVTYKLK